MFFHPNMDPHNDLSGFHNSDDEKSNKNFSNFVVIIMAAGEGKRMNSNLPKVLHPVNKKPMLVRIVEMLDKLSPSPRKILIVTGKHHDLIKAVVSKAIKNNNIEYIQQKEPKGTGDAIKCCLNELNSDDNVLILNGDMPLIKEDTILEFVNGCDEAGLVTVDLEEPKGYGRIIRNKKKEFMEIKEDKDCNEEERNIKEVNAGIYFFHSLVLKTYIPNIDNNNKQKEYYLTSIIEKIREKEDLEFNLYKIPENRKHEVLGVNTQEELQNIENILNQLNKK